MTHVKRAGLGTEQGWNMSRNNSAPPISTAFIILEVYFFHESHQMHGALSKASEGSQTQARATFIVLEFPRQESIKK